MAVRAWSHLEQTGGVSIGQGPVRSSKGRLAGSRGPKSTLSGLAAKLVAENW